MPMRLLAAEITRERIYHWLHDELPYATTVETTSWAERNDGSVRVEQTIFVERDSQKSIVLGKGGCVIRQISMEAREELARLIEQPVHLFLFVKVREDWGNDPERVIASWGSSSRRSSRRAHGGEVDGVEDMNSILRGQAWSRVRTPCRSDL